jgi:hypothetical protein
MAPEKDPAPLIHKQVREMIRQSGPCGLNALLSEAIRLGALPPKGLRERILSGEALPFWNLTDHFFKSIPKKEKPDFTSDFIASKTSPWRSGPMLTGSGFPPCMASFERMRKLFFSRPAGQRPGVPVLKRRFCFAGLWQPWGNRPSLKPFGSSSRKPTRYRHAQYLDKVRGLWLEQGDPSALDAFAASGSPEDIPALKEAIDLGMDEEKVKHVMEAIETRHSAETKQKC